MNQHILIIDDEVPVRELLEAYFKTKGYQVTTTGTAAAALDLAGKHSFDLILLDVVLPDEDGLELLKSLKTAHPALPVIIMTAFGFDNELMKQAKQNGASGYVTKTGPLDNLLRETERSLGIGL